jgi:hypothetical protein
MDERKCPPKAGQVHALSVVQHGDESNPSSSPLRELNLLLFTEARLSSLCLERVVDQLYPSGQPRRDRGAHPGYADGA